MTNESFEIDLVSLIFDSKNPRRSNDTYFFFFARVCKLLEDGGSLLQSALEKKVQEIIEDQPWGSPSGNPFGV